MSNMRFRDYLLNEDASFLNEKIGDLTNAMQNLLDNSEGMGKRQVVTASKKIVNQIRTILHTHWPKKDTQYLAPLQKVGVAIMNAIEEKDDLSDIMTASVEELQKLADSVGTPVNALASPEKAPPENETLPSSEGESQPEQPEQPEQQPQPPEGPQMPPQQPQMDPNQPQAPQQPQQFPQF